MSQADPDLPPEGPACVAGPPGPDPVAPGPVDGSLEDEARAAAEAAEAVTDADPGEPAPSVEPVETSCGEPDPWGEPDPLVEPVETQLATARLEADDRLRDLQRLQAEYLNYKKRVERDRELVEQNARYKVLAPIVEVLDTVDRAREHGDLDPGLKTVADQLERVVAAQGLLRFGSPGDPFDPTVHEALSHLGEDAEVTVTTCKVIAKAGYRIGDRVVRAAQVLVVDPLA